MKLSIHKVREEYGSYLSDVELIEALFNGDLRAYYVSDLEEEQIVPSDILKQVWGKQIRKAQLMKYLISPQESFATGGYGPCINLNWTPELDEQRKRLDDEEDDDFPKMKVIFLINMYFKKVELEQDFLPGKIPVFNYIQKADKNFSIVRVRNENGDWVSERYKLKYGLIIKALVETFIRDEDSWLNLDELIDELEIEKIGQQQIDKFFKNKIIKNYIDSKSKLRHIKLMKEMILPR